MEPRPPLRPFAVGCGRLRPLCSIMLHPGATRFHKCSTPLRTTGVARCAASARDELADRLAGRLWSDDELRDVLAGDGEVPVQVGGSAGEVSGQAAGDE